MPVHGQCLGIMSAYCWDTKWKQSAKNLSIDNIVQKI